MEELENAYQNLDIDAYFDMLNDLGDIFYKMNVYDYEEELIATLDEGSILEVMPHFCDGMPWGWNVYTRVNNDLKLIDTFDTCEEGEALICKLRTALESKLPVFKLPY